MRADLGDDEWVAHLASVLGDALGSYQLLGEVGRGSQGVVYRARTEEGDEVALKLLHGGDAWSEEDERRLAREVQILERLDHPDIVRLRGTERTERGPALVFDWVDGAPLDRWAEGRDQDAILRLFVALSRAVEAAHAVGVVHRDLKPSNVLVDADGHPRILDFGIARARDASVVTRTGAFVGSEAYASPEQLRGETTVGPRSDVYTLGVNLHRLLTGTLPTAGVDDALPRPLRSVLEESLEPDPRDRYGSAGPLADDLERVRWGTPVHARPRSLGRVLVRWSRERRAALGAASLVGILLVLFLWQRSQDAEEDAAQADVTLELAALMSEPSTLWLDPAERRDKIDRLRDAVETLEGEHRAKGELLLVRLLLDDGDWIVAQEALDRAEAIRTAEEDEPGLREIALVQVGLHIRQANATAARQLLQTLIEDPRRPPTDAMLETAIGFHLSWGDAERAEVSRRALADRRAAPSGSAAWRLDRRLALEAFRVSSRPHEGHSFAIELLEEVGNEDPAAHAVGLWILGLAQMNLGQHATAIETCESALERYRQSGVEDPDPFTARLLGDLGQLYQQMGHLTQADRVLTEAMFLLRPLRREHAEVALLAQAYRGKTRAAAGRFEEGIADLERALTGQEVVLGPHHPEVSYTHEMLAAARAFHGDRERAQNHLHLARTIRAAAFGPNHRDVASIDNTSGAIWYRSGEAELSIESFLACLAHLERTFPGPNPFLQLVHTNLAAAHRGAGKLERARHHLALAIEVADVLKVPNGKRSSIEVQQCYLELAELRDHPDQQDRTAWLETRLRELGEDEQDLHVAQDYRCRAQGGDARGQALLNVKFVARSKPHARFPWCGPRYSSPLPLLDVPAAIAPARLAFLPPIAATSLRIDWRPLGPEGGASIHIAGTDFPLEADRPLDVRFQERTRIEHVTVKVEGGNPGIRIDGMEVDLNPLGLSTDFIQVGDITVNLHALPRSYFMEPSDVPQEIQTLDSLRCWSVHENVQAQDPLSGEGASGYFRKDATEIVAYEPELVEVRSRSPRAGFVVLADTFRPGWVALVDGEPSPVLRAQWSMRAVAVPAGEHTVQFRYRPRSLATGALISALGFAALVALIVAGRWLRRRQAEAPPDDDFVLG